MRKFADCYSSSVFIETTIILACNPFGMNNISLLIKNFQIITNWFNFLIMLGILELGETWTRDISTTIRK